MCYIIALKSTDEFNANFVLFLKLYPHPFNKRGGGSKYEPNFLQGSVFVRSIGQNEEKV